MSESTQTQIKTGNQSNSHPTMTAMTAADCLAARQRDSAVEDHSQEHTRHLADLRAMPEVRADRVARIKQMIADGSFDTDARLSAAIDRMLAELRHH
ncbi:MAG: flagellar biosynthesis anti-sigma factor FlgM [Phycisphaerales bacterium]|nr:flagellar biosynthesis anti-sigma factor FlgM [Phycisphaerales bacterium]